MACLSVILELSTLTLNINHHKDLCTDVKALGIMHDKATHCDHVCKTCYLYVHLCTYTKNWENI